MSAGPERVVFLSGDRALVPQRAGPFAETLLGLAERGARDTEWIAMAPGAGEPFRLGAGIRVLPLGASRGSRSRNAALRLGELIEQGPPPLVVAHEHGLSLAARGAWRWRERCRAWIAEVHHLPSPRGERWLLERRIRVLARAVDAFRCVEPYRVPERLRALGVPAEKVHCVPSVYLDLDRFRPGEELPREVDLLFVARWERAKGVRLLGRVLSQLAARRRGRAPLRVELVGRGAEGAGRSALRRVPLDLRCRERVSEQELVEAYRRARVLLVTSRAEGGPRVVAEALACGTPVITTEVGRVREWITTPTTGEIVPPEPAAFVSAWERVVAAAAAGPRVREAAAAALRSCERRAALGAYRDFLARVALGAR